MFDLPSRTTSQFDKGQSIALKASPDTVGIIVAGFYNEFSGQWVYTVRVPGMSIQPQWAEPAVIARKSVRGVDIGDMVIVDRKNGTGRDMGQVVETTPFGKLMVKFADGTTHRVGMKYVWRVITPSLVQAAARVAA